MKKRTILLGLGLAWVLSVVAEGAPVAVQDYMNFWRFIVSSPTATGPYSATDFIALSRNGQTYRAAASDFVPNTQRLPVPAAGFFLATQGNGGSNSNDCLAATVAGGHGPCLTKQYVADLIVTDYDASSIVGGGVNVHMGAGNFNDTVILSGPIGSGAFGTPGPSLNFIGVDSIGSTSNNVSGGGCGAFGHPFTISNGAVMKLGSLSVSTTCTGGSDFFIQNGAYGSLADSGVIFGQAPNANHIHLEYAQIELAGAIGYKIGGAAISHLGAAQGGFFNGGPGTRSITVNSTYDFSGGFFLLQNSSLAAIGQGLTFNFAGVTGPRAVLQQLSNLTILGATPLQALTYLPGDKLIAVTGGSGIFGAAAGTGGRPQPTLANLTAGIGTGGTATLTAGSSNLDGTIVFTSGSAATGATVAVDMALTTTGFDYEPHCSAARGPGWITTAIASTSVTVDGSPTAQPTVTFLVQTNGAALATGTVYRLNYTCTNS